VCLYVYISSGFFCPPRKCGYLTTLSIVITSRWWQIIHWHERLVECYRLRAVLRTYSKTCPSTTFPSWILHGLAWDPIQAFRGKRFRSALLAIFHNLVNVMITYCISKAWSKGRVCGRSLAGIVGSYPSGSMGVCLLWVLCVIR
jgi:hypothetical protein